MYLVSLHLVDCVGAAANGVRGLFHDSTIQRFHYKTGLDRNLAVLSCATN